MPRAVRRLTFLSGNEMHKEVKGKWGFSIWHRLIITCHLNHYWAFLNTVGLNQIFWFHKRR